MKQLIFFLLVALGTTQAIDVNIEIGPPREGVIYVAPSPDYNWDPGYGEYDRRDVVHGYSNRGKESRHSHGRSHDHR